MTRQTARTLRNLGWTVGVVAAGAAVVAVGYWFLTSRKVKAKWRQAALKPASPSRLKAIAANHPIEKPGRYNDERLEEAVLESLRTNDN